MHVLATAGHVDHGKSTLVRALTGMEPDRWAEERRRGMTIDLGFAWTTLPSGEQLAFVDVPGHERFIGNMLAGIGPATAVLFVVAADEGWSAQSEEHLAAVHALALSHGLLAVTRSDLADPAGSIEQSLERIARSSLGRVEHVAVSGATGAGVAELRTALDRLVARLPAPEPTARLRLWVDRAFTVRGSGTVVTGTLGAGSVAVGDELELRARRVLVRGVQSLGEVRDRVSAVARIALNLRGVARDGVGRGDVLVTPGAWPWTSTLDVRLDTDADVPANLVLHIGTAALPVRLRPLRAGLARLSLSRGLPVPALDDLAGVRQVGGWLVTSTTWERWLSTVPVVLDDWLGRAPLDSGMPLEALRRALDVPDRELLAPLVAEAGLRSVDGRVVPPGRAASLGDAGPAVRILRTRLDRAPFAAPERHDLDELRLGRRELAAAEKAGLLLRISDEIVLLPTAPQAAAAALRALPQPFTTSQARQALGTTRRVAVPLLEYLDAHGLTERVDQQTRRVRP